MPHELNLSHTQNLKPHDDESNDRDYDSKFGAFAEELNSNWYNLIAYDKTFNCLEFYQYLLLIEKTSS